MIWSGSDRSNVPIASGWRNGLVRDLLIGLGGNVSLPAEEQIGQSARVSNSPGLLNTTRAFEWAIVFVGDSEGSDIQALDHDAGIGSSETGVVIAVRPSSTWVTPGKSVAPVVHRH